MDTDELTIFGSATGIPLGETKDEQVKSAETPVGTTPDDNEPNGKSEPNPWGDAHDDRARSAEDEWGRTEKLVNKNDENLPENLRRAGQAQIESARSRSQQSDNYPYQYTNLAKNNPRGNLNRAAFNDTLRYSRLADRLNNRMHWTPGISNIGTGQSGVLQAGTMPTVSRWEPIKTQEMRQMRANEALDERARQAGVDLQSRVQAYPQNLQEATDAAVLNLVDNLQRSSNNAHRYWQQLVMSTEYRGDWERMFKEKWQQFLDQQKLYTQGRLYEYLTGIVSPMAAKLAFRYYGSDAIPPSFATQLMDSAQTYIMNNKSIPDDLKPQVLFYVVNYLARLQWAAELENWGLGFGAFNFLSGGGL